MESQTTADDLGRAAILVVDDEDGMRNFLSKTLGAVCGRVDLAADTAEASRLLDQTQYDVILLDNVMPGQSGVDWLREQSRIGLYSDAILMTAYADLPTAIAALKAGASDFLLKPFRSNQVINAITQSLTRSRLSRQNAVLRHELEAGADILKHRKALVGSSPEINGVRDAIGRAALSQAHGLILGEVGTGKQVAARMLHDLSPRAEKPFIWAQCRGMTEASFEARLLGRVAEGNGAADQPGFLMDAAGGTLFLDDIDALPAPCQNLLMEVLSAERFQPLGAGRSVALDVRIVGSATRSLKDAVGRGDFRADLYYRLAVIEVALPPLRERAQDALDLAEFFLEALSESMGLTRPALAPATRRRILAYPWPGNVMELRNWIERALIHGDFDGALGHQEAPGADGSEALAAVERRHILGVLEACGGNRAEAARRLGVARKTIDRKCAAWGV